MEISERVSLIKRHTADVLGEGEIENVLERVSKPKHYIGFEISGKIHLGTGIVCMAKVKEMIEAGVKASIFLADWHTWINDKLGGDREVIKRVAVGYFKEGLKASLLCVGANPKDVEFVLGSELYHHNDSYWQTVIEVSKHTTLARIKRSITIMGRKEGESIDFAKLIYPPMQVADIFSQGIHFPHAGLDQRKAQVIARDVALKLKLSALRDDNGNVIKPIAIHHPLVLGLGKPPIWPVSKENLQEMLSELKMSKSKPDSCVFIHDSPDEIKRKVKNAFCPEGEVGFNPVLDWAKNLVFRLGRGLEVKRPEKFGGDVSYSSFEKLERDFKEKKLHPADLKSAVAEEIVEILRPAREHFSKGAPKRALEEFEKIYSRC